MMVIKTCQPKSTSTLCRAVYSGTAWQGCAAKVAPCYKYMWMLRRLGCGMPFNPVRPKNSIGKLSVPLKEAARHIMSKGFQNGISQFEKKIRQSSPVLFHSFYNLKKVYKKIIFSCGRDRIGGICRATFAVQQSCSVLHSAVRHSVDAP